MKRYLFTLLFFVCFWSLGIGQNTVKEKQEQSKNYVKINGIIKPAGYDTVKQKEYYIEEQGNSFLITFPENSPITTQNFFEKTEQFFKQDSENELRLKKVDIDNNGIKHYSYDQYYKGIRVLGGYVKIHEKPDGKISSVTGRKILGLNLNASPNITAEDAKQIAISDLKKEISDSLLSKIEINVTEPELLFVPKVWGYEEKNYTTAYSFSISGSKFLIDYSYIIDGYNGEILKKVSNVLYDEAIGSGKTIYSGTQNFATEFDGTNFILNDELRNISVYNSNYSNTTPAAGSTNFTDNDNIWNKDVANIVSVNINSINDGWDDLGLETDPDLYLKFYDNDNNFIFETSPDALSVLPVTINVFGIVAFPFVIEIWDDDLIGDDFVGGKYIYNEDEYFDYIDGSTNFNILKRMIQNPALDILYGLQKTYDFYLEENGLDSYDDEHSTINAYVNFSPSFFINNAQFNQTYNAMLFGMGDGIERRPWVELDVVGHEYTHQVIRNSSNLAYSNESGALNESFADIIGASIEYFTKGETSTLWYQGQNFIDDESTAEDESLWFDRSFSNPNSSYQSIGWKQADTYKGDFYFPTDETFWDTKFVGGIDTTIDYGSDPSKDYGGVHENSGVQNFWFYLISEGGTGVNDLGNSYNVEPIGIEKASEIAYNNMAYQLDETSTFADAVNGSTAHAIGKYGGGSFEYNSVRNAWYAVGLLDVPGYYCSGVQVFNEPEGIFTDGSLTANYNDGTNCSWYIAPTGATSVTLTFSEFFTEFEHDSIIVYDGNSSLEPVLLTWSGHDLLPPSITSSGGEMLIVFKSDGDINDYGWTANYTSATVPVGCSGTTTLSSSSGYFNDGSGIEDYTNNNNCSWLINPPFATNITLNFSSFTTEEGYDFVNAYDGYNNSAPLMGSFSGTSLPTSIISSGGVLYIEFISDGATTASGWYANYTSDGVTPISTSMSSYEYWFDYNYIDNISGTLSGPSINFNESIDVSALTNGLHSFHIRFKDNNDLWSSVLSQFFVKTPVSVSDNVITTAEYWFDNNYIDRTEITGLNVTLYNYLNDVDVSDLNNGLHSFHMRFKDANNLWSSVFSQFFVKVPQIETPNKIITYEYWFDDEDYSSVNSITLTTPVNPYELEDAVDVTSLSEGEHRIHFRFEDINGLWSSVVTDTFNREAITIAEFTVIDNTLCYGSAVSFDNASQGATNYLWDFGDSGTSNLFEPTHIYSTAGTYTITLTASNTTTGNSDTYTIEDAVAVFQPTISVSPPDPEICEGENILLTASGANTYTWSPASGLSATTGASVTASPSVTSTYTITGTDVNGCTDYVTVTVIVNPLPVAEISPTGEFDLCEGETITLTSASTSGNLWSTGETGSSITVDEEGTYTVTVTNSCGSEISESVVVNVTTLPPDPVISISGATEFCEGESVLLTSNIATGNVWSTGETSTSISVDEDGSYFVSVSNSCGTGTSDVVSITVNPLPEIPVITSIDDLEICAGESVILTSDIDEDIIWSTGETTASIVVDESGIYYVTNTNDCGSETSEIVIVSMIDEPTAPEIDISGATEFCEGETVTLTSSYASGNTWSTGSTSNSIIVSESGIYSVSYAYECGSVFSEEIEIIVNPLPEIPSISTSGSTSLCSSETLTLTSDITEGITWSTGATSASIIVSEAGDYFVTASNDCGEEISEVITVTVNEPPLIPIITTDGATEFCEGGSVTLTSSNAEGNVWSTGETTESIVATETGIYTVTTLNDCGEEISEPITVTVNENPVAIISADGTTEFCEGEEVLLTASGGDTYLWSTGATSESITVSGSGTFDVLVTSAEGCFDVSDELTVTVHPLPALPVITNSNDTLFTAEGFTYQWYFEGILIPGADDFYYVATEDGNYSVEITDANSCSATSDQYNYVGVGINGVNNSDESLIILPNPNNGNYQLIFNSTCSNSIEINLFDAIGNLIFADKGTLINNAFKKDYSFTELPKGNYVVKVVCEGNTYYKKLVIQ